MSDAIEHQQAVRTSYDAVARTYAAQLGAELDGKPLDRAEGCSGAPAWPRES